MRVLYEACANELQRRILALIPDNPGILKMDSPWDLFGVDGFKCDDLQPSMGQAAWALDRAKKEYKSAGEPGGADGSEPEVAGG